MIDQDLTYSMQVKYSVSSEGPKDIDPVNQLQNLSLSSGSSIETNQMNTSDNMYKVNEVFSNQSLAAAHSRSNQSSSNLKNTGSSQTKVNNNNSERPDINQESRDQFQKILHESLLELIKNARSEKAFIRKNTRFDPIDFLAEQFYNRNPKRVEEKESQVALQDIPFVKKSLAEKPRKEKPLCQRLSDDEATLIIQRYYRGYRARSSDDIQELRKWQADYRSMKEFEIEDNLQN